MLVRVEEPAHCRRSIQENISTNLDMSRHVVIQSEDKTLPLLPDPKEMMRFHGGSG